MLSRYYTLEELEDMKFYELPTVIYNAILEDVKKALGIMTKKLQERLNNAPVMQLDQYCNIWRYIQIVA